MAIKSNKTSEVENKETLSLESSQPPISKTEVVYDQPREIIITPEMVEEFIKSFFDYTSNKFPKGETAILTAVEKKFGEDLIGSAQETIHKMTAGNDQEIEKIKKLAGVK